MRYRILGPLDVTDQGRSLTPTAPKAACVLAALLVRANDFVLTETLMEEIWGNTAPASAGTTLQTYIYQIRCALGRAAIQTRAGGYLLPAREDELDVLQFRAKVREGRRLLDAGSPEHAASELHDALELWRGRPLSNVRLGRSLESSIARFEEERREAAELSVEAGLQAGRHRKMIGVIRELIADDPYNEWLHARLVEALTRSGRRREALQACESLRRQLAEDLGLDPSKELRDLELQVLHC